MFQSAADAAEGAQVQFRSSAAVAMHMEQSKQFAIIMQLYSELQETYHSALLSLLVPVGQWAGTLAELAYVLCCNALGKEPQKEVGSKLSLAELTNLVNLGLTLEGQSLKLVKVAERMKDLLALTGNKPIISALVLPDLLTLMLEGSRYMPVDKLTAVDVQAANEIIKQAFPNLTEEGLAEVSGRVHARIQIEKEVFASRDAIQELLLSALRFAAPPVNLGAGVDWYGISRTLTLRWVSCKSETA
jgi:hypothetical protein